jgi:hypothetical protein
MMMNRQLMDAVTGERAQPQKLGLTETDEHVLLAMAHSADDQGIALATSDGGYDRLTEFTGLMASTIEFSLASLERLGFVSRDGARYRVLFVVDPDDPARLILQPRKDHSIPPVRKLYTDGDDMREGVLSPRKGTGVSRRRLYTEGEMVLPPRRGPLNMGDGLPQEEDDDNDDHDEF